MYMPKIIKWSCVVAFVFIRRATVRLCFRSMAPVGIHSSSPAYRPPPSRSLFSLPCLWVTSMHHFRGRRGGKRQINKLSFQSLYSRRELDEEAAGIGGGGVCWEGVLWPAIENCCPYPERSVYTTCKVKQIDPGCRFTCAAACNPPSLSSSITEHCCWSVSLSLSFPLSFFLSHHTFVCEMAFVFACVCVCVYIPHVDGRPGSRKALGETSSWHGALSETGLRLVDVLPHFSFLNWYIWTHTTHTWYLWFCQW